MFAKKSLGQNFLMHAATADRIADAANLSASDTVLEVGPGTGMLTKSLLGRAGKVIAIETDKELIPTLEETFKEEITSEKLTLIHSDIRQFDPGTIQGPYALVANIPYYITGEIIRQFLTTEHQPSSMTLLVQKEVAERIVRSQKESLLSLSVKVYGNPAYMFTVSRGNFVPAPNVDSAVLSIRDISRERLTGIKEDRFFEILRAGFGQKRKQLAKNLSAIASPDTIQSAFKKAGLEEKVRAEDIHLDTWLVLAAAL